MVLVVRHVLRRIAKKSAMSGNRKGGGRLLRVNKLGSIHLAWFVVEKPERRLVERVSSMVFSRESADGMVNRTLTLL